LDARITSAPVPEHDGHFSASGIAAIIARRHSVTVEYGVSRRKRAPRYPFAALGSAM
jgi:hypothetical protein